MRSSCSSFGVAAVGGVTNCHSQRGGLFSTQPVLLPRFLQPPPLCGMLRQTRCAARAQGHTNSSHQSHAAPLTAMDSGKSPKQAAEHAKRRAKDPEQQR